MGHFPITEINYYRRIRHFNAYRSVKQYREFDQEELTGESVYYHYVYARNIGPNSIIQS